MTVPPLQTLSPRPTGLTPHCTPPLPPPQGSQDPSPMANPPNPDGIPSPGAALLTPHPSAPHPSPHRGPTPLPSPGGGGGAVPGRGVGSEGWGGGVRGRVALDRWTAATVAPRPAGAERRGSALAGKRAKFSRFPRCQLCSPAPLSRRGRQQPARPPPSAPCPVGGWGGGGDTPTPGLWVPGAAAGSGFRRRDPTRCHPRCPLPRARPRWVKSHRATPAPHRTPTASAGASGPKLPNRSPHPPHRPRAAAGPRSAAG